MTLTLSTPAVPAKRAHDIVEKESENVLELKRLSIKINPPQNGMGKRKYAFECGAVRTQAMEN